MSPADDTEYKQLATAWHWLFSLGVPHVYTSGAPVVSGTTGALDRLPLLCVSSELSDRLCDHPAARPHPYLVCVSDSYAFAFL